MAWYQKRYVKTFGDRVIGYGHFVSDDGRDTLGTSFFMQLDDRAAADAFVAGEPMSKAGVYQRVEIHRWSNSFQKRAADYRRKGMQQFLCTGPKTGTPEFFREHLHAHESYFASYGDFSADQSARPMAPTISAPHCCWNCRTGRRRTSSGTRSRLPRKADISGTRGSRGGCLATDWCWIDGGRVDGHVATLTEMAGTSPAIAQKMDARVKARA